MQFTIPNLKDVLGWLTYAEAGLLYQAVNSVSGLPGELVEIGNYCGRSTLVIADALRAGTTGMLHSFDPHLDNEERYNVDSWMMLTKNLEKHKLWEYVLLHKYESHLATWDKPVKLLFIDGEHDRESVQRDFNFWYRYIVKAGLLLFHDSFEDGPQYVIEHLDTETWQQTAQTDSLTVFKRVRT